MLNIPTQVTRHLLRIQCTYENFVVFFDEVETTVVGNEGCDLLAVLDQLNTDALANGRVGLFSFNTDL